MESRRKKTRALGRELYVLQGGTCQGRTRRLERERNYAGNVDSEAESQVGSRDNMQGKEVEKTVIAATRGAM